MYSEHYRLTLVFNYSHLNLLCLLCINVFSGNCKFECYYLCVLKLYLGPYVHIYDYVKRKPKFISFYKFYKFLLGFLCQWICCILVFLYHAFILYTGNKNCHACHHLRLNKNIQLKIINLADIYFRAIIYFVFNFSSIKISMSMHAYTDV